jgi:hypothetical protein
LVLLAGAGEIFRLTVGIFEPRVCRFEVRSNPGEIVMKDFPEFMKRQTNRIASGSEATPGGGGIRIRRCRRSHMAFWTCHETAVSAAHVHDSDEPLIVVAGCYTLTIEGKINAHAVEEFYIPRGLWHGGEVVAGTRTIHAFSGRRAERVIIGGISASPK